MHFSTTRRLAAILLTMVLCGFAPTAHPQNGDACVDAPAELQQHLASDDALGRLHTVRDFIEIAIKKSGHAPHELVGRIFAEPLTVASRSTATGALLPQATPLKFSDRAEAPLTAVIDRLERIHEQLDIALAGITDEQADRLRGLLPDLLDRTSTGSDLKELEHGQILAKVQTAIDQPALKTATALLAGLAKPELAAALADHYRDAPPRPAPDWLDGHVTGSIVHAERTARGAVIIGGPANNVYTGPAAIIIDTGGDDTYALPAGDRVRVILDLQGDDNYTSQADAALAGSVLGASLIADHAGNDTYAGGRITQGAAVAGVGMLHDHAGNDRYHAAELAQGASLAGIGVLIDNAGDDLYSAARFAQGFGGALGTGVLSDRAGNDVYIAGNKHPSSYDVPGNYQTFAQGVGMGFRNDIAGGIGLLRDHGGDDHYTAGNYSQGAGYYLGAGLLIDENGSDNYSGGRYTQGAAAHLGVGLLRDEAGNDTYTGGPAASQGGAWDQSIAALLDCAGDDDYTANEFGQGAAAQNAIAFFIDIAGENQFAARRNTRGHEGPNDYHENGDRAGNLAVFITEKHPATDTPATSNANAPSATPGRPTQPPSATDQGHLPEETRAGRGDVPDTPKHHR